MIKKNPRTFDNKSARELYLEQELLLARASSSNLQMRLDIVIMAGDSELTDLAGSTTSSAHSREELLELRLLVPTWIMIPCGFLRKSRLICSLRFMSCVLHPGNVAILT